MEVRGGARVVKKVQYLHATTHIAIGSLKFEVASVGRGVGGRGGSYTMVVKGLQLCEGKEGVYIP